MKPANDNKPRRGQACRHDEFPLGTDKVYVLANKNPALVKIGTSKSVYRRVMEIKNASFLHRIEIVGIFLGDDSLERLLHRYFSSHSLGDGGEWFVYEGALAEWVDAGCSDELTLRLAGPTYRTAA